MGSYHTRGLLLRTVLPRCQLPSRVPRSSPTPIALAGAPCPVVQAKDMDTPVNICTKYTPKGPNFLLAEALGHLKHGLQLTALANSALEIGSKHRNQFHLSKSHSLFPGTNGSSHRDSKNTLGTRRIKLRQSKIARHCGKPCWCRVAGDRPRGKGSRSPQETFKSSLAVPEHGPFERSKDSLMCWSLDQKPLATASCSQIGRAFNAQTKRLSNQPVAYGNDIPNARPILPTAFSAEQRSYGTSFAAAGNSPSCAVSISRVLGCVP